MLPHQSGAVCDRRSSEGGDPPVDRPGAPIRQFCEPLYAETGRPSIPPEQLFLARLGGYRLGVTSERAVVRELTGNLVLRWFVGLDGDQMPWDHSTGSQNRTRRVMESGLLERVIDKTVAVAIKQKLVAQHTTLEGTLGQANASHQRVVPMEVVLKPADDKQRIWSLDAGSESDQDPGNPPGTFRGERRANQTPVSTTDPDATLANKGNGTAAMVGSTVNGLMAHRHRLFVGSKVESFRGLASEREGGRDVIEALHHPHKRRIHTVGADTGSVAKPFLTALFRRHIRPHSAAKPIGRETVHQRVRRLSRTTGYRLSQRARKKIEELWGRRNAGMAFGACSGVGCCKSELKPI